MQAELEQPAPRGAFGTIHLVSGTFGVYGAGWSTLFLVAAIGMLPLAIINSAADLAFDLPGKLSAWQVAFNNHQPTDLSELTAQLAPVLVALFGLLAVETLSWLLLGTLCYGALVKATGDLLEHDQASVAAAYAASARALLPMLLVCLLLAIAGSIPLLMLFLLTRLSVTPQGILIDRKGPIAAIGRSWQLTSGHFFPVFWTLVLVVLLAVIASSLITAPAGALPSIQATSIASAFLGALAGVVLLPLVAAATTITHFALSGKHLGTDAGASSPPRLAPLYPALKVARDGRLFLNGRLVPGQEMDALLAELAAGGHQLPLFLESPQQPRSADQAQVVDRLAAAGVRPYPGEQAPSQWGQLKAIEVEVAPRRFRFALNRADLFVGEDGRILRQGDVSFAGETQLLKSAALLVTADRVIEAGEADAGRAFDPVALGEPSVHLRLTFGDTVWAACFGQAETPPEIWAFCQGLRTLATST